MNYLAFIRQEYRFLLFGFFMMGLSNYGQTFFIALYSAQIRTDFSLSNAEFGGLYSAMTLLSAFVMVYSGRFIDMWPLRRFTAFVLVGLAVGGMIMGLATHVFALALALFLLRHFGQALSSHTAMTAIGRAYDANRGQAVSLIQLGYAGFEGFFPLIAVSLIAVLGWQQSWFAFAACLIFLALPLQLYLSGAAPIALNVAAQDDTSTQQADRGAVLCDRRFYMVLPLYVASPFLLTGLFFHQVLLAETRGWSIALLAGAFSLYAAMKIISSLMTGLLVDRFTARRVLPFMSIPLLAALSLIMVTENIFGWATPFVYMGLIGIHLGMAGPVSGGLWPELFGTKHLGAIRSLTSPIVVASTAISPVLFGGLLDASVGFDMLAFFSTFFVATATVLAFLGLRDKL